MERLEHLLTLNSVRGIGSMLYQRLISYFGGVEAIAGAPESALTRIPRIGPEIAAQIKQAFRDEAGKKELELAQKHHIRIIAYNDAEYPKLLSTIFDSPLVLYVRGQWRASLWQDGLALGVVGSRRASIYGEAMATKLSYAMANYGFGIVSGLARGIDAAAHQGCLRAKDGYTVAVLGNGLSRVYPPEHKKLADQVIERGALVSELAIATPPHSRNFPARNRIISGLSMGVLVVEAPLRSGALITADLALDQGREVFAIPGKIDSPASHGCHRLIKQGAKLVETPEDIIEELPVTIAKPNEEKQSGLKPNLDYREELIIGALTKDEPKQIDDVIDATGLPPALASSTLLMLELKHLAKQLPGRGYIRTY